MSPLVSSTIQFYDNHQPEAITALNMNNLCVLLLVTGVSMAAAGTRYIAIPIDGIDVIEVNPILPPAPRYPRQTEAYLVSNQQETESQVPRIERSTAQILDYVDFGAQTGMNGAYSWYTDYPAHH
ncbi:uncharacterized protein [Fopius arisanus]|uniref:Uncharacterized protein n=1 Tax=Fopius arisanus TaxID=64838 RepID=A0A9R1T3W1_9HYME|nr:PREDICTED: uncharacterized protein LOC105266116 [Fopius arisanus]